jgi:hypothetical protein
MLVCQTIPDPSPKPPMPEEPVPQPPQPEISAAGPLTRLMHRDQTRICLQCHQERHRRKFEVM